MVQEKILDAIDSEALEVFVVWMPVLASDNFAAAQKAPVLVPDGRALHYWDGDQDLGRAYGRIVELPRGRELAWDIYFVFEPGVVWQDIPPSPNDWAHQLGMDERHLKEGEQLQAAVQSIVAR